MIPILRKATRASNQHSTQRRQRTTSWTLAPLESRLMLAGDVGAAISDGAAIGLVQDAAGVVAVDVAHIDPSQVIDSRQSCASILFVDAEISDAQMLMMDADVQEIVLLQADQDPIAQITETLRTRRDVAAIHLLGHGQAGEIRLAGAVVDETSLRSNAESVGQWGLALTSDADILIYGCETGAREQGQRLMTTLAALTGADIAASVDITGTRTAGGDWDLERTIGVIQSPIAFADAATSRYQHTMPITIRAAGATGDETMALQIDGVTVQTWSNIGGDFNAGVFETYTYNGGAGVTGDQVRVAFTNDLYQPGVVDRNLRVDSISIDGLSHQSEDPRVFGTGTWKPGDGITPGFRESEIIHSNGYFEYFDATGSPGGSQIVVRASGAEGGEQFNLQIDGQTVGSYTATTGYQSFIYTSSDTVSIDQVRIEFTNDLYVQGSVDRNLNVDSVQIDGTTFQTEDPTVFSTGTWLPADGIVPGFRLSETLHANGYFQYAADTSGADFSQPSVVLLENAQYSGRFMRLDEGTGNVVLSTINDEYSQWRVTQGSGGSLLQNVATGQFLEANGSAGGGNVDVSNVAANANLWTINDSGVGTLTLRNVATNGYLDGDPGTEGWNVEQSPSVSNDDNWIFTLIDRTQGDLRLDPSDDSITFAAFGDYGTEFGGTPQVAALVDQLGPDIIVTLGDARYYNESYADIHAGYSAYLNGTSDGAGESDINRFFPAAGNHDYTDDNGISDYLDYFALPGDGVPTASNTGSELTYDFLWGPVHFFVLDSQAFLNDPTSAADQTTWLQTEMQASTAAWQVVMVHHSPYSSGNVGPSPALRLPYADWGADLVLSGHDHGYERLDLDGISYVVSGLGGESIFGFQTPVPGSVVRYAGNYGLNMFTATQSQIIGSFVSVDGVTQDTFVINAS
ncbi:MAG: DUF4347 domain-containing protein [Pirellulaceae bacterium]|nr:DUF4347 domain-containing protein [Pirellulaceae bacterium]